MPKDGTRFTREQADKALVSVYKILEGNTYQVCGSYRRNSPDVGDIDILVLKKKNQKISLEGLDVDWSGEDKIGFQIDGLHVDIKFVPKESWGAGLLHHTGPWGFNIKLRSIAKKKDMILNEYGLFMRETREVVAQKTEKDILYALMNPASAEKFMDPSERKTPEWLKNKQG